MEAWTIYISAGSKLISLPAGKIAFIAFTNYSASQNDMRVSRDALGTLVDGELSPAHIAFIQLQTGNSIQLRVDAEMLEGEKIFLYSAGPGLFTFFYADIPPNPWPQP